MYYVFMYSAPMYVCVPSVCLVPSEAEEGAQSQEPEL